jgi:spermidine/putrescine transport system substrate-binding protein
MARPRKNIPSRLDRRQFLIRGGLAGVAGVSLPALLAACGNDDGATNTTTSAAPGTTVPDGADRLIFDNWPDYIDPSEDGAVGTVERFIAATGIAFTYNDVINSNNEYFAQIQPILGRGERIDADIIAPTGWMAGRLINLGWCDPLPLDQIPNAANLEDSFRNPAWDPTGEYSLPWQAGFAGIAYNLDVTGRELNSIDDLWNPEFAGKIGINTEMRDTIGLIAMSLGIRLSEMTSFDIAQPAFERLQRAKDEGQIRKFHGNDYAADLINGNLAATIGWSGDVAQYALENPAVRFAFPESGATSWADTMIMPKGARNRAAAATWMNFVYDPVEAAQLAAWVQYVSPVKGVREELDKIDPELAENPLLFPDAATQAQTQSFPNLSDDVEAEFDAAFSRITGA